MSSEFYRMQLNYLLRFPVSSASDVTRVSCFYEGRNHRATINFLISNEARGLSYKPDKLLLLGEKLNILCKKYNVKHPSLVMDLVPTTIHFLLPVFFYFGFLE